MRLSDLISETFLSLTANKVRSGLTILGIVVGIASVIAMLSIGKGSQVSIESSIASAGSNQMTIQPSSPGQQSGGARMAPGSVESLTSADAEELAKLDLISGAAPQATSQGQIVADDANVNSQVIGATPASAEVKSYTVATGSFITERDVKAYSRVIVLGYQTAIDLFGEGANPVGKTVRINGSILKVVGVLAEKGTSGFTNVDSAAIMPLTTMQRYFTGSKYVSSITLTVSDSNQMDAAETAVTAKLMELHGISDSTLADFTIQNMADLLSSVTQVTDTFTTLLAGIAGISLLVGGIGIMNMMLTTVTERTREIGLRKSIGATDGAISIQFLSESITLTLLGGVIGIIVGWLIGMIAGNLLGTGAVVTMQSIALAASVCAAIGVVFGYYPAQRAARLSPIESLRYQ